MRPHPRFKGLSVALLAVLAGCESGGTEAVTASDQTATVSADLLLRGDRSSGVLSFEVELDAVRLLDGAGNPGPNLLTTPVRVELIGTDSASRWLARGDLPLATSTGVRLEFDPDSAVVRDPFGEIREVDVVSPVWTGACSLPTAASGPVRLTIDMDLRTSLRPEPGVPPRWQFDGDGSVKIETGPDPRRIDEVKGRVVSLDPAGRSVTVLAHVDDDGQIELGQVTVRLAPMVWLVNSDGTLFLTEDAFYAALQPSQTFLEVHGDLGPDGELNAMRIEVEDQTAGAGTSGHVEIEGLILNLGIGFFDLLVREVEKGAPIVNPVMRSLGQPPTLSVAFDIPTRIFAADGTPVGISSLAVGQEVDVEFPLFTNEPFSASEIEVQQAPRFAGRIDDGSDLPDSFVMVLQAGDPAVLSGDVASSTTEVRVDPTRSTVTLLTRDPAPLSASLLQAGIEASIEGTISGPPSLPTLDADRILVSPGHFIGFVSGVDPAEDRFDATVTGIPVPFGESASSPPFTVRIDPDAVLTGVATDPESFFRLFQSMQAGQVLSVEVEGIGSGLPDEILAFHISTRVR